MTCPESGNPIVRGMVVTADSFRATCALVFLMRAHGIEDGQMVIVDPGIPLVMDLSLASEIIAAGKRAGFRKPTPNEVGEFSTAYRALAIKSVREAALAN